MPPADGCEPVVFVGPVEVRQRAEIGGGRGLFATADISAGTLLMRERPLVTVPTNRLETESLHAALARALFTSSERETLLQKIAIVYPQNLNDVPAEVLGVLREQHAVEVQRILTACKSSGGDSPDADEVLRIILVMRFNAFYSGAYVQVCEADSGIPSV
jgi:hypothetical protein